jgi:hypothetical protein
VDENKFGFLDTDEVVDKKTRKADYERSVLGGCVSFSLASTAQLAAVGIPFLIARSIMTTGELYQVLAIYLIAAGIVGALFTVTTGLSGLFGSLSGLVPAATFLWLRLSDAVRGVPGIEGMEPAEYPSPYAYLVPIICTLVLAVDFLAALFLRRVLARGAR